MIGGRLNGRTLAWRICAPSPNVRRIVAAVKQREADDREHVVDLRHLLQKRLDLFGDRTGPRHGGTVGQLHGDEKRALILFGQESSRRDLRYAEDAAG